MRRHGAGRRGHVGVETAGVERFLHRGAIRLAGQPQSAAHGGDDEFTATPARARAAAAEGCHRDMHERRIPLFELRAPEAASGEPLEAFVLDEEVRCRHARRVGRFGADLRTE